LYHDNKNHLEFYDPNLTLILIHIMIYTFILLLLLTCIPAKAISNSNDIGNLSSRLRIISVNDGLPQQAVTSIMQDKNDFMWLSTYDGLCRYDGYTYHNYHHISRDTTSLSNNRILSTFEDSRGNIWVGTEGSPCLNLYNSNEDNFFHDQQQPWIDCRTLAEDANGIIWMGTSDGLFLLDVRNPQAIVQQQSCISDLTHTIIKRIVLAPDHTMWILTANKIYGVDTQQNIKFYYDNSFIANVQNIYCDSASNLFITHTEGLYMKKANSQLIQKTNISIPLTSIFQINEKKYIGGTERNGLLFMDKKEDGIYDIALPNQLNSNSFFSSNLIRNFYIDRSGSLWIGSGHNGAAIIDLHPQPFHTLKMPNEEIHPLIRSILKDSQQRLWIGIKLGGLYMLQNGEYTNFSVERNQNFNAIFEDTQKNIWICTNKNVYIYRNNKICNLKEIPGIPTDIYYKIRSASTIIEDSQGAIWIGGTGSLLRLKNLFTPQIDFHYYDTPYSLDLFCMNQDKYGRLWFGSRSKGVFVITLNIFSDIIHYQSLNINNTSIKSNQIWDICPSNNGERIWLATDSGVNCIDISRESTNIMEIDGNPKLTNSKIMNITEDKRGELWLNSSQGLLRYNPNNGKYREYYYNDGLCSNAMTEAVFLDQDGTLYIGTINGITYFDPQKIFDVTRSVTPQIVDFKIYNHSVIPNQKINSSMPLEKSILKAQHITIEHLNNNFTFEFIAPDYKNPQKIRYAYKMDKIDSDWNYVSSTNRTANYNHLRPGNYVFHVKAANMDGIWGKNERSIAITVKAAPWKTWWAYMLYTLGTAAIILLIFKHLMIQYKLKRDLQIEHIQREHERILNDTKLKFHTNISHEIRTALTLIATPLNDILCKPDSKTYQAKLNIVQRNVDHLNQLVSQFLDLRKIDKDVMPLCVKETNISRLVNDIFNRFKEVANYRSINLSLICETSDAIGLLDEDKIIKILSNLISNALKFTPQEGFVTVFINQYEDWMELVVEDTGCGIASDDIKNIFERYYQNKQWQHEGMGIGLSLVHRLVELHKGSISVQSIPTGGRTTFTVKIPIGYEYYDKECITEPNEISTKEHFVIQESKPTVMIVEDNQDMCEYLRLNLTEKFNIITDDNVDSALSKIESYVPDLILLDIMLKEKNGLELCTSVKENIITNHIPILILSAKDSPEDIALGYSKGAEDYILKPFSMDLLFMKIDNIIRYRHHTNNSETPQNIEKMSQIESNPFFDNLVSIIHENISDSEFGLNTICDELNLSRTQLYRKVKAITDISISTLIRDHRMQMAREMLQKGQYNISEVMYQVGISSNSYFTKTFREYFGMVPSEFIKRNQRI